MRVLLFGVYKILVKALKQGLEEEGITVDVAGVDRAEDNKTRTPVYDVIIHDLNHPREAGLPLERWRRSGLRTPVLVLTAPGSNEPARGLAAGADDWLIKPFKLEDLFTRLQALASSGERGRNPEPEFVSMSS